MTDPEIDEMCTKFKHLFQLWDGVYATARTVDPTEQHIELYDRFVDAAMELHLDVGCSLTHKCHLAWVHTKDQMRKLRGGLGDKTEDWVERQHQDGGRLRVQFSRIKNLEVRAIARAKAEEVGHNPDVIARINEIKCETARDFKKKKETKSDKAQAAREQMRMSTLLLYESKQRASSSS